MTCVSVILPFYHRVEQFKRSLRYNEKYFARKEVEVIVCIDEPDSVDGVMEIVKERSNIKWKVLAYGENHPWRPPCAAINSGIRASSSYCMQVFSPETIHVNDGIAILRDAIAANNAFAIGQIRWLLPEEVDGCNGDIDSLCEWEIPKNVYPFYGSVCFPRHAICAVCGYDESRSKWGGDDDDVRQRMWMAGFEEIQAPEAHFVHADKNKLQWPSGYPGCRPYMKQQLLYQDNWGKQHELVYSWDKRPRL